MSRICESCQRINFGKWGTLGLIGYSLIVGAFGYVFGSLAFYSYEFTMLVVLFGVILWLPMYYIDIQETRRAEEGREE